MRDADVDFYHYSWHSERIARTRAVVLEQPISSQKHFNREEEATQAQLLIATTNCCLPEYNKWNRFRRQSLTALVWEKRNPIIL